MTNEQTKYYTLRIGVAMCFIGHGAFGIITKAVWCNYFATVGISHETAYRIMPLIGSFDILLGVLMLLYPVRAIPAWLVVWGTATAMLRPLSGEPVAECIERAGNYGAPLALLILAGVPNTRLKAWFKPIGPGINIDSATSVKLILCLQAISFLLLAGHGWLNIIAKKSLLGQYTSLGFSDPAAVARLIGICEVAAACAILVRPARPFILALLLWKAASECFYPHYEFFEWIERGGSYAALLALWLALGKKSATGTHAGIMPGASVADHDINLRILRAD